MLKRKKLIHNIVLEGNAGIQPKCIEINPVSKNGNLWARLDSNTILDGACDQTICGPGWIRTSDQAIMSRLR
jgi:hypothetical protein